MLETEDIVTRVFQKKIVHQNDTMKFYVKFTNIHRPDLQEEDMQYVTMTTCRIRKEKLIFSGVTMLALE